MASISFRIFNVGSYMESKKQNVVQGACQHPVLIFFSDSSYLHNSSDEFSVSYFLINISKFELLYFHVVVSSPYLDFWHIFVKLGK